jgi:hypothetical protein
MSSLPSFFNRTRLLEENGSPSMMRKNDMFNGVVVRSVECANRLGDEAVAAGLRISGLVEVYSFEGPDIDRSAP